MKINQWALYALVIIFSGLFLFVGNRLTHTPIDIGDFMDDHAYYVVVVESITSHETIPWEWGMFENTTLTTIEFYARITSRGERRGEILHAQQEVSDTFLVDEREVMVGSRIMVSYDEWNERYVFNGYVRLNRVLIFGILLLVLMIVFARKKGINAIIALGFTCMAVFLVFIPGILSGRNIYVLTLVICFYAIVSTLLLVVGANRKAFSAMLGCVGGIFTAGIFMLLMDRFLFLTGAVYMDTARLLLLPIETPINLRALVFAGVILGAMGAIMDVSMSIASSLWEVKEAGGKADFVTLFTSGVTIGKDILGTMLNTLILAYIGASLTLLLPIVVYTTSYTSLFNLELIIVEFVRALVGSFGMLLTIPLTALICAWLYQRDKDKKRDEWDEYFSR